ncbi:MAG: hypothetical protein A3K10_02595 [Bacteroidetes bacterium RIFCSPLOWO2_12_FULL_31_6]|nr:MAG: hypothetical protein A3K10_02595 [Bacteroidetes bacterium RIFCSPLOWO2_12_FULL_31_6]
MSNFLFYSNGVLKLFFNKKIWVHRVNCIEKLSEVQSLFYGVELDVVFIDSLNQFDVNHPPAESINLSLLEYLSATKENKNLHFWLDFKNLETSNQIIALNRLNFICEKLKLTKSNFIVESGNLLLTKEFSKSGYQVSYYLHWPGLYTLEKIQLLEEINRIKISLNYIKYPIYLSSDYHDYEILKENFPQNDFLLWIDGDYYKENKFKNRLKLFEMLSDSKVEIILFNYKSKLNER